MIKLVSRIDNNYELSKYNHVSGGGKLKLISDIGSAALIWILILFTLILSLILIFK